MKSNHGQVELDNSSEYTEETIRRFLLGDLREAERPPFEERLLTDHSLAGRVRRAEIELADDYAYERLSSADRELFEETFLLSSDREKKVSVSRSLRDHFAPVSVSSATRSAGITAYVRRLQSALRSAQPVWRFAFAAAIFILVVGTAWIVVKEKTLIKEEIRKGIEAVRFPRRSNARHNAAHPPGTSSPEHESAPRPSPSHDQVTTPRVITSVALIPGVSWPGDKAPSINLPKGDHDIVRLQLAKLNEPGSYWMELLTLEGQPVVSAKPMSGDNAGAAVDFDVPAQSLKAGNYQLRLVWDKGGIRTYYFRAQ